MNNNGDPQSRLSELFSGLIALIMITCTAWLALDGKNIPSTVMLIDGYIIGSFYSLKGASGTIAGFKTALTAKEDTHVA